MPRPRKPLAITDAPHLGGILDDVQSYISQHGDDIASIAEVVVPVVAPWTAPVVAAEHALRTHKELSPKDAKAATEGATAVGKAVAAHIEATQVAGSSEETSTTTRASEEFADPDAKGAKGAKSSSTTLVIVGAVVLGLLLLAD